MAWLPFICLILAVMVITVLYRGTVGHIHAMVHELDQALGIHEDRLNTYGNDLAQVAEILEMFAEHVKACAPDGHPGPVPTQH